MNSDPVSWFLIEPGWKVVAADGTDVGTVADVAGDAGLDIFDGLTVSTGLVGSSRHVPAEQIAEIRQGEVELALTREEFEGLSGQPPAGVAQSVWQRLRRLLR